MDVLQYHHHSNSTIIDDPSQSSCTLCRVEMLHVPWNPADVNTVQGRYPSPHPKPHDDDDDDNNNENHNMYHHASSRYFSGHTVVGSEGWGRVTDVLPCGSGNKDDGPDRRIQQGSLVTLGASGHGTMRSSVWIPAQDLLVVPEALLEKVGPAGCTLFQLGGTALRLLTDFVTVLQQGDTVLQNAGNSGVGILVSQLAKALWDANVVSLVRQGQKTSEETAVLLDYLTTTARQTPILIPSDEDMLQNKDDIKTLQEEIRNASSTRQLPKLALNAVGGTNAQLLLKLLDQGGTMVTYGGMSGKGVQVGTPQLIFKDLHVAGYWHSRWMLTHSVAEKQAMINTLSQLVLEDQAVLPPVQVFPLRDLKEGLQWQSEQSKASIRSKLVWDCQE
jgi:mitochondrial enoyl-[acyl-carrier protein] reductase / trans-2-enoyl-CoA reductase